MLLTETTILGAGAASSVESPSEDKIEKQTLQGMHFQLTIPKYYETHDGRVRLDFTVRVQVEEDIAGKGKPLGFFYYFAVEEEAGKQSAKKFAFTIYRSGVFHQRMNIKHVPRDPSSILFCLDYEGENVIAEMKMIGEESLTLNIPLLSAYLELTTAANISKEVEEDSTITMLENAVRKIGKEQRNRTLQETYLEKVRSKIIPGIQILLEAYIARESKEEQQKIEAAIEYFSQDPEYQDTIFFLLRDYLDPSLPNSFLHEYQKEIETHQFNRTFELAGSGQRRSLYIMISVWKYVIGKQLEELRVSEREQEKINVLKEYNHAN